MVAANLLPVCKEQHPSILEANGDYCSPLLGTAMSKQRCEIWQVGYMAASTQYLSCYKLPIFFFLGKNIVTFCFINLIRYNLSQLFSAVFVYFLIRTDTGQLV